MKAIYIFFFLSLISLQLTSQEYTIPSPSHPEWFKAIPPINEKTPQWAITMYTDCENYYKIQEEFTSYYSIEPFVKNIHTQNYKHWNKIVKEHINKQGKIELPDPLVQFEKSAKKKKNKSKMMDTWTNIGPFETVNFDDSGNPESRPTQANVFCLSVAPSNTNTVYASAETGEIFKSIDKGINWESVSKDYVIGNLRDIKVDPLNENIVYGTRGGNLYYTSDGGSTWTIKYTFSGSVEQLLIDPDETNKMYAACENGLYFSSDYGNVWVQKYSGRLYDLEFKPGTESTIYIAVLNSSINRPEIHKSIDSGDTWTLMDNGYYAGSTNSAATVYGCKIGVTPADPERLYAGIIANGKAEDNGWIGIYYSLDGGNSWQDDSGFDGAPYHSEQFVTEENWYVAGYSNGYHQGFYNFDLDVSHIDPDKVWLGTIWFCESGNKGGNIEYIRGSRSLNMHADIQDIDVIGNEIWIASDGGINYSNDECATVSTRMKGITASDYWGFGQGWNTDTWVGGRYHNGNAAYHENYGFGNTLFLGGAESGTGYVNQFDNTKNYHSDIGARKIPETFDQDAVSITNLGLYPNESYFHFSYSEVEWHPNYGNIVYAGKNNVFYKSIDGGVSFDTLSILPDNAGNSAQLRRFEISREDPNYIYLIVYYSTYNVKLYRSTNGGETFELLNNPNTSGSWRNLSITLNPFDKNEIWIASEHSDNSNKVFSSTDSGNNWTNRYTTTIQNARIKDLVYQPSDSGDIIYAMDDDQFYYFNKNTNNWTEYSQGLPAAHKGFMTLPFFRDNKLRMATAKGIWEAPMIHPSKVQALPMLINDSIYCDRDTVAFESYSIVSHIGTTWTWNITPQPEFISNPNARNPKVVFGNLGSYDISLTVQNSQGDSHTTTIEDMINIQSLCSVDFTRGQTLQTFENGDYFVATEVNLENITHFTMTGWWKPNGSQQAYAALASSGDWCAHCDYTEGLIFNYGGDKLWYKWPGMADNWASNSGIDIPLNEWSYVALTITPSGATMYLNDKKYFHEKALSPGEISSIYVGYGHYSKSFKGEIDEVTLWDRALSDDEIYKMRYLTKEDPAINDPSLIAYYQFNTLIRESLIMDHAGLLHGSLINNAIISPSGAPIGKGQSDLIVLNEDDFQYSGTNTLTDITISDCDFPDGKLVISHIEIAPNENPEDSYTNVDEYWVINQYDSDNGFISLDTLGLSPKDNSFTEALGSGANAVLHTRDENSDLNDWVSKSKGVDIIGNTIVFDRKIQISDEQQISLSNGGSSILGVDPGKPCEADIFPGNALNLPGNNGDYSSIPPLNLNSNTITMSAWVKADGPQNTWAGILFCRGGSTTMGLSCANNNELRYHWNGGEYSWSSGAILPEDEWAHVALVIDVSSVTIYLNGVAYSRNANHQAEAFDAPIRIGNDPNSGSRTFQGEIDEVVVWNRVLTQDEIRELRHLTKEEEVTNDNDLVVYLQFNEETGKAYDKSGNRLHSVLNGNTSRLESSAPVGGGSSEKLNITTSGTYTSITGVEMLFNSMGTLPQGEIVITRIDLRPYNASESTTSSRSYWVINNYGQNQSFTGLEEITFMDFGNTTPVTTQQTLRLMNREENADLNNWQSSFMSSNYIPDTVTFENVSNTEFGQYVIGEFTGKGWIGEVNNDWDNPGNWLGGTIPTSDDHVVIPYDVPFYPILNMNVVIKSLNLMPGAKLIVPEEYDLGF